MFCFPLNTPLVFEKGVRLGLPFFTELLNHILFAIGTPSCRGSRRSWSTSPASSQTSPGRSWKKHFRKKFEKYFGKTFKIWKYLCQKQIFVFFYFLYIFATTKMSPLLSKMFVQKILKGTLSWQLYFRPDYLATVDVDPASPTYSQVIFNTLNWQSSEIFYCQFFSSFKPAWATDQWV